MTSLLSEEIQQLIDNLEESRKYTNTTTTSSTAPSIEDTKISENVTSPYVPIYSFSELSKIYSKNILKSQEKRYSDLVKLFTQTYKNNKPDFLIRSPGRVNIIGEHIDYCGYSVFPMAIEKDIIFAVRIIKNSKNKITLINKNNKKFTNIKLDLSNSKDTTIDNEKKEKKHWSLYFLAAFNGVKETYSKKYNNNLFNNSLEILVDGTIPAGSGLSSSSAFVCGSALVLLYSNGINNNKELIAKDIASFCIECERYVGVDSGGMDQTIIMTAQKDYAKYIEFIPKLNGVNYRLPNSNLCKWVVLNSLVEHSNQNEIGTQNYNTRVVECRLSAIILAKYLNIKEYNKQNYIYKLRNVQDISKKSLEYLLSIMDAVFTKDVYYFKDIESILDNKSINYFMWGLKQGDKVCTNIKKYNYKLYLKQRCKHVFSEALRVINFSKLCKNNENNLMSYGDLMNKSHISCKNDYECSSLELNKLVELSLNNGSIGCRLTGAGWGGCCVALVPNNKLNLFIQNIKKDYYTNFLKLDKIPDNAIFWSSPSSSAAIINY